MAPNASVSLNYDDDTIWWNGNEHWIEINQAPATDGNGTYYWNTTGVAPGTYYIAGYLWSNNEPTFCHVMSSITIVCAAGARSFHFQRGGGGCHDERRHPAIDRSG